MSKQIEKEKKNKSKVDYKFKDKSTPKQKSCGNDVSWYTRYPNLVHAASSIIFNEPYGKVLDNKHFLTGVVSNTDYTTAVPGGYIAWFSNALTCDGTAESPLNVALKNFQTYVRHANSGSVNYEGSDLMQYLLSVISLYPIIEDLKRDMKLVLTYKATNRYMYKAILESSGYTSSQINAMIQNYAQYVSAINIVIAQLNSFKIPKEITLIHRREWLSSHVFKDDELDKASLYMFKPADYLHYDWANALVTTKLVNTNIGWDSRLQNVVVEINNLLAYEDIGIMIGDILKAYGNDACHYTDPLILDQVIDAEYSQEAGEQFRNLCCTGTNVLPLTYRQTASDSQLLETYSSFRGIDQIGVLTYVYSDPVGYADIKATIPAAYKRYPILMADADQPDSSKVLVNTRLQWISQVLGYFDATTVYTTNDIVMSVNAHGTEIITKVTTFTYGKDAQANMSLVLNDDYATYGLIYEPSFVSYVRSVVTLYPTRFAPQFNAVVVSAGGGAVMPVNLFEGLNNIVLGERWLETLHQGCLMSLLTLPMFKLLESK